MPSVSVIIPNYNHVAYLTTRIESVLAQTYDDFEIILMDDASSDESLTIINSYTNHPKVSHVIINRINQGNTFKQWNKGISLAKGEFIWIAESDDYAAPEFLATAMEKLSQNLDAGFVFCHSHLINDKSEIIGNTADWNMNHEPWSLLEKHGYMNGKKFCQQFLTARCAIPNASAVVFSKYWYNKIGKADESLQMTSDWKMWFAISMHTNVLFTTQALNFFRCHNNTVRHIKASIMKQETLHNLKYFHRQFKINSVAQTALLEHLFEWSFKQAIWKSKYQYSWQNLQLYLQNSTPEMRFYLITRLRSIIGALIRYYLRKLTTNNTTNTTVI